MIYWRERYIYAFLVAFCLFILYVISTQLQEGGPRIAPYSAVGIILLSSLVCFLRCIRGKEKVIRFSKNVLYIVGLVSSLYGIYVYIIEIVGYFVLSAVFLGLVLWILEVKSKVKLVLISVLVPFFIYLLLGELLNLRFPNGIFI